MGGTMPRSESLMQYSVALSKARRHVLIVCYYYANFYYTKCFNLKVTLHARSSARTFKNWRGHKFVSLR